MDMGAATLASVLILGGRGLMDGGYLVCPRLVFSPSGVLFLCLRVCFGNGGQDRRGDRRQIMLIQQQQKPTNIRYYKQKDTRTVESE